MSDIQAMQTRYGVEQQKYGNVASAVAEIVGSRLRSTGIECRIESRAKDMASLLLKAIEKKKAYESIGDKAGVRAVLKYPQDRAAAAEAIRRAVRVVKEEDFERPDDPRVFTYSGLHFDVEHECDGEALRCEVQLHTPGESLWANTVHDLIYKGSEVPYSSQRVAHRLRAMAELCDSEATNLRRTLEATHMQNERDVLGLLRRLYMPFVASAGRPSLSLDIISSLVSRLPKTAIGLHHALNEFVANNQAKLERIYARRDADPLLAQPESLLMFYMLELDPSSLVEAWPPHLPDGHPRTFSELWAVPVHDFS